MDRADGAGIAVVGHGRDLTKLGLVEGRIGDDRADGGVGHKLIFYHLIALIDSSSVQRKDFLSLPEVRQPSYHFSSHKYLPKR